MGYKKGADEPANITYPGHDFQIIAFLYSY